MIDEPKGYLSALGGLVLVVLGLIPLLNGWGIIPFGLPGFLSGVISGIVVYIIAAAGLWVLIDGFMEDDIMRIVTCVAGVIFLALGVITLLNTFGVIGFAIPGLGQTVYNIIFVIEGILLVIAAFVMI